ncbi:MAG TPA: hypothetical protein PKJ83_02675 [Cyclobacteriaceae bacterium]|nr:hypothetical protein [Cyclobacteriaceae bacterium]HPW63372.1 hypothetical protein [Cyclobacteriaceae bacterium]
MTVKNIFIYYLSITIPVVAIVALRKSELITSTWFVILLFAYLLIYRVYVDSKRLIDKGIIEKKDFWKMILPGQQLKYFKELYLH